MLTNEIVKKMMLFWKKKIRLLVSSVNKPPTPTIVRFQYYRIKKSETLASNN